MTKSQPSKTLDIDARFILANDRTLLAWVRTSLAIEAGGLVLLQIHPQQRPIAIGIILAGAVVALIGYSRYHSADRAIRRGELPASGLGPAIEVGLVVAIALGLAIAELTVL